MNLQAIQNRIFSVRGLKVMTDFHLAELYDVGTKTLNQAVKRNPRRFPSDFMFQLTVREWDDLKNEIAIDGKAMRSQFVTASSKRNIKHLPFVFTEQGVAMLSSILKSDRAIDMNVTIMRTFVILRQHISNYAVLGKKIEDLERQIDRKFKDVHEALNYLMSSEMPREIGFKQSSQNP